MQEKNLEQAIYLDTDNLVCQNLDTFIPRLSQYGMTFTGYSAHICFVLKRNVLESLCEFITKLYKETSAEIRFKSWEEMMRTRSGSGGVSDMTLFYWFHEAHPDLLASYNSIFDESPFDISLDDVRDWEADESGLKKIVWEQGIPYAEKKDSKKKILLATMHHQGKAKIKLRKNAAIIGPSEKWYNRVIDSIVLIAYRISNRITTSVKNKKNPYGI